jgi:tetratricopeptide (TPR) repeat protein
VAVSAAPRPQTEEPGHELGADEGWTLLDGLRRRLDDQVAQTRKTSAQVSQLADSVAALVELGRKRSRWLNLNSFIAYLIFTIVLGGAFIFVYQSRAHELVVMRDRAIADRDRAAADRDVQTRRADDLATKLASQEAAFAKATEVAQAEAVVASAQAAVRAGRFGEAIAPLEKAVAAEAPGARAAEMHYLLGLSYAAKNQLDKAAPHLQAAVDGKAAEDDARFQLASVLDRVGQWAKARGEYDKFATAHPQSPNAVFAMRRSATLAHLPASASWNGPPKPATAAAAPLPP